jgi:hypothetical protein
MKKMLKLSLVIILFTSLFISCDSLFYPSQKSYEKVYTDMTIQDFLKEHSKAKNEYLSKEVTIYSIRYMETMDKPYSKFYYFEDNKLIKVDKGERAVDYRIRID